MSGPAGAASYRHLTDEDTQREPPPPYSPQASGQQNGSSQGNLVPNQGEQEVPMNQVRCQQKEKQITIHLGRKVPERQGTPIPIDEVFVYPAPQRMLVVCVEQNALQTDSTRLRCPACNVMMATRVERVASLKTQLIAVLLFLLLCIPCAFVPFCCGSCKDTLHYCSNCDAYLGVHKF